MPVYNTIVTVVANLEAPGGSAAITMLACSLHEHGFDTITDAGGPVEYAHAFEAEWETEPDILPAAPTGEVHGWPLTSPANTGSTP